MFVVVVVVAVTTVAVAATLTTLSLAERARSLTFSSTNGEEQVRMQLLLRTNGAHIAAQGAHKQTHDAATHDK